MDENVGFFARSQSNTALTKFKGRINSLYTDDEFELERNTHIQTVIQSMANAPDQWDELCEINIGWIGNSFISLISDSSEELSKEKLDDIFLMCFRFLVVIFIYYFRVLLFNYKSVKSQLLQIELRKTLCRFIQHYTEYSSQIKEKDSESLGKFENIIFSGIVSNEEKFPSTDGIEQLGKLIKAAKS